MFLQAGEYMSFGPLDMETADALALVLWVAAPIAGGLTAHRFSNASLARTAFALGLPVGLFAAFIALFGSGTGDYTCAINLPSFPGGYLLGSLVFGALPGVGMGVGFFVSGVGARRSVTVLPGIGLAWAATWGMSAAAYLLYYGAVRCLA